MAKQPRATMTDQAVKFCQFYADPGSSTYHNGTKSAIAAGYSAIAPAATACRMLKRSNVRSKIDEIQAQHAHVVASQTAISLELLRSELIRVAKLCEDSGDRSNWLRAIELLGKSIGAWADVTISDPVALRQLDERTRRDAARIARVLMLGDGGTVIEHAQPGDSGSIPLAPAPEAVTVTLASLDQIGHCGNADEPVTSWCTTSAQNEQAEAGHEQGQNSTAPDTDEPGPAPTQEPIQREDGQDSESSEAEHPQPPNTPGGEIV